MPALYFFRPILIFCSVFTRFSLEHSLQCNSRFQVAEPQAFLGTVLCTKQCTLGLKVKQVSKIVPRLLLVTLFVWYIAEHLQKKLKQFTWKFQRNLKNKIISNFSCTFTFGYKETTTTNIICGFLHFRSSSFLVVFIFGCLRSWSLWLLSGQSSISTDSIPESDPCLSVFTSILK